MPKHASHHFRIIFRKNHLWLSEFLGLFIVGIIFLSLGYMGYLIYLKSLTINTNRQFIATINPQRVIMSHALKELRQKVKIAEILDRHTRRRLSDEVLSLLVENVYTNSKTFGYDPLLVLAVIHVESYFDPQAKGQYKSGKYSGAFGLMQLKVATAREVAQSLNIPFNGVKDLYKPEINIPLGVAYLTQMISWFQSLKLGILAYNQGPGTIRKTLKNKKELSIQYYNKVLKSYFALKKIKRKHE